MQAVSIHLWQVDVVLDLPNLPNVSVKAFVKSSGAFGELLERV